MYTPNDDSEELESAPYSFCIETRLDFCSGLDSTSESASSSGIEINGRRIFL
jgi:hypothetical protein